MCWNNALFKLPILMSLFVFFQANVKVPRCFTDVFKFTILTRDTINTGVSKYVTLRARVY